MSADETAPQPPVVRVEAGNPTAEELAVLTALLAAGGDGGPLASGPGPSPSGWADHSRALRPPISHSPGGWQASGLPR